MVNRSAPGLAGSSAFERDASERLARLQEIVFSIAFPDVGAVQDLPLCELIETTVTVTTTASSAQFPHRLGRIPRGAIYVGQNNATMMDDLVVQPDLLKSTASAFWFRRWRANPASGSSSTTIRFLVF